MGTNEVEKSTKTNVKRVALGRQEMVSEGCLFCDLLIRPEDLNLNMPQPQPQFVGSGESLIDPLWHEASLISLML